MIIDISKEQITNELLEAGLVWMDTGVSQKTVKNTKKYLGLNWDNLTLEQLDGFLQNHKCDIISGYLFSDTIKNKDILLRMFKYIEFPSEEYLWNGVVDTRYISDAMYQKNTYEENFDVWFKMNSDNFNPLPEAEEGNSYQVYIDWKNEVKDELSPKQAKEKQRRDRVCQWLDENISLNYHIDIFKDIKDYIGQIAYVQFKFNCDITVPVNPLSFSDLDRLPVGKKLKYSITEKDVVAFTTVIKGNESFGSVEQTDILTHFLFKANLPQIVDKYIKFWVKERIGEINPRKNS